MTHPGAAAPSLRRWPIALVAGLVIVGTAVTGVGSWQGAAHLVALPPLDLVADLGVAFSVARSPLEFVGIGIVSLGARSVFLAALLGRLDRTGVALAVRFYLVAWVPALVAAALIAAAQASLFYALYWFGLVVALGLFGVMGSVPWVGTDVDTLRAAASEAWRQGLRLGTLGCYLSALLLLGALATAVPAAVPGMVAASAVLTWATAQWLRHRTYLRVTRRAGAASAAAGLVVLAGVVVTGPDRPPRASSPPDQEGSLVLMSGIDSSSGSGAVLEIDPVVLGFGCEQTYYYSYAGPGDGQPQRDAQCPIDHGAPYEPKDTMRGRDELAANLVDLTEGLPRPLVVVAHSQAAWIAWDAAADGHLGDDTALVLVGPFTDNPLGFDPAWRGATTEPTRAVLSLVANVPRPGGGTSAFDPESPLAVEWLAQPVAVRAVFDRDLPDGVTAVLMRSLFDLPLTSGRGEVSDAIDLCPVAVIHPNLPYAADLEVAVDVALGATELPDCPVWRTLPGHLWHGFAPPPSG